MQEQNLDFFLTVGLGLENEEFHFPVDTHVIITVAGKACVPCQRLKHLTR